MLNLSSIDDIIKNALKEDIGTGDITTLSTVPKNQKINGKFIAKEDGLLCGLEIAESVFRQVDDNIDFAAITSEGASIKAGDVIAEIKGSAHGILTGERLALNFLQRLSGIATKTANIAAQIKETKTKITDTRKTTPGLRILEKYAVRMGGGTNHRFNLSDGILIKDNHIVAAGGISNAVDSARKKAPHTLKIEVEVETFEQIDEALKAGADIIMLDNMDIPMMKEAVVRINKRALVEASGNMGNKNILEVAKAGVDFISVGALTHTVKSMDISLKFFQ